MTPNDAFLTHKRLLLALKMPIFVPNFQTITILAHPRLGSITKSITRRVTDKVGFALDPYCLGLDVDFAAPVFTEKLKEIDIRQVAKFWGPADTDFAMFDA